MSSSPNWRQGSLLRSYDRWPPYLLRFLARRGWKAVSLKELVKKTGWSQNKVQYVMTLNSWANLGIEDIETFTRVCGFNFQYMGLVAAKFYRELQVHQLKHLNDRQARALRKWWSNLPKDHPAHPENR